MDSLRQMGSDIDGGATNDQAGFACDLSADGTTIAVGAPFNGRSGTGTGQLRVFQFDDITFSWNQIGQDIYGELPGDQLGYAVSLSADGSTVVIGSNDANGDASGHIWIYSLNEDESEWKLVGARIDGPQHRAVAGWAVAISADASTIAYGAPLYALPLKGEPTALAPHGLVRVFKSKSSKWWTYGNDLVAEAEFAQFGFALSLSGDGNRLIVGAPMRSLGELSKNAGQVNVLDLSDEDCLTPQVEPFSSSTKEDVNLALIIPLSVGFLVVLGLLLIYIKWSRKWWRAAVFESPNDSSENEAVRVFISHYGDDTKPNLAKPLHYILKELGITSFFDQKSIPKCAKVKKEIAHGLHSCELGLVIISENFLKSIWCRRELNTLYKRKEKSGSAGQGLSLLCCYQSKKLIGNPDYSLLKKEGAIVREGGVNDRYHLVEEIVKEVLSRFDIAFDSDVTHDLLDKYLLRSDTDAPQGLKREVVRRTAHDSESAANEDVATGCSENDHDTPGEENGRLDNHDEESGSSSSSSANAESS